jgi:cephalosporin hydroxylase
MSELENIFKTLRHGADKWQPYFKIYEKHLSQFKNKEITLVEVGVQQGGSLEMWAKYFGPKSKIVGIDIDFYCSSLKYEEPNISVTIGNQADPNFWNNFLVSNKKIDIFIDDGSHYMNDQIVTFEKIFPMMEEGGVFICEDTHTSYSPNLENAGHRNPKSFIEYAKEYVDVLHHSWMYSYDSSVNSKKQLVKDNLNSIAFYDSVVVFEKAQKEKMKRISPIGFNLPQ